MAGEKKKILKFKLVENKGAVGIPSVPEAKGRVVKLKVLGKEVPATLSGLEGTPAQLNKIMNMLEEMNKFQNQVAKLEKLCDWERNKRLVAEGELKALKPQLEKAEAEIERYREMEEEYGELKREHEKLAKEAAELEIACAREDLKNLKEALWAADGHLNRIKRDLREGTISEKEYELKTKQLLKDKWDAQHKMLILENWLKKAVVKTKLVAEIREKHVEGLELVKIAEEAEKTKEGEALPKEKPKRVEEKPEKRERKPVAA